MAVGLGVSVGVGRSVGVGVGIAVDVEAGAGGEAGVGADSGGEVGAGADGLCAHASINAMRIEVIPLIKYTFKFPPTNAEVSAGYPRNTPGSPSSSVTSNVIGWKFVVSTNVVVLLTANIPKLSVNSCILPLSSVIFAIFIFLWSIYT